MNDDQGLVKQIKKGLEEHCFYNVCVLGKAAKADVEKVILANFTPIEQKRIKILVYR